MRKRTEKEWDEWDAAQQRKYDAYSARLMSGELTPDWNDRPIKEIRAENERRKTGWRPDHHVDLGATS